MIVEVFEAPMKDRRAQSWILVAAVCIVFCIIAGFVSNEEPPKLRAGDAIAGVTRA
jgi:hypothetical protein